MSLPFASPSRPTLPLVLGLGTVIGIVVSFGLYGGKISTVALLPLGLLVVLPGLVLEQARLYWLAILLLSLQFTITKNLNDGLPILTSLKIDYLITHFTFDISASDLAFLMLVAIWAKDRLLHRKPLRFPPVTWLAVGYLSFAFFSMLNAPSRYLVIVEMWQQVKYFAAYLFAVNCLDSKKSLRVLAVVAVVMLLTQAAMTVTRFETGYMTFFNFGDSHQDPDQVKEYLTIDRSDPNSSVRAFGTLNSPNETTRLCLMLIPFALFLCVPNGLFGAPLVFMALASFGVLGPFLTFTRVYFITSAVQVVLAFIIMVRSKLVKREMAALIVLCGVAAIAAASPKIYKQFTIRSDSVSVRQLQNQAALEMIRDHPLFGVGLNNAPEVMRRYSRVTYDKYDANTQFYSEPINNMALSLAAEIGVVGTLLFVAFFGKATLSAWRARQSRDPEMTYYANALFVAFCGFFVNFVLDPFDEYPVLMLLWMFAGVSLNLQRMSAPPSASLKASSQTAVQV